MKKKIYISISTFAGVILAFYIYLCFNYQVPILMYHAIDKSLVGNYAAVSPEVFLKQMKYIKNHGYNVIPLDKYCRILKADGPIPRNSVVITFDDGHKDNFQAVKVLKKFEFPATIFIIVGKIGHKNYLSRKEISWIVKNSKVTLGSHTLTESYLPDVPDKDLAREIVTSKEKLERLFGIDVDTFSYTIGGFDKRSIEEVKSAGYLCACTTNRGFNSRLNRFALRRIKVTNRDLLVRFWSKLSGFYNFFKRPKYPY